MSEVVIVGGVRTPFGKRNGGLAGMHATELLGGVLSALIERTGIEAASVGQVIGGCVGQVGMQTMNVTRNAWLTAGLPESVPGCTVDAQCGSSQQASSLAFGLVASGVIDVAIACGVEVMSRVPMGATTPKDGRYGKPVNRAYWAHHEFTSQFEAAERIADKWALTRADCDQFSKQSHDRAQEAQAAGRFAGQLLTVEAPVLDEDGKPTGEVRSVSADEGVRDTTLEGLARLKPTGRPDGVHTAGSSSQISDGASAVMITTAEKAASLGLTPMATIVDVCLTGSDPALMLTGPIDATRKLLADNNLQIGDIDCVEINEAFASVVLAWQEELKPDSAIVNPNGGAIALGHPLGATGTGLLVKAVHELGRGTGEHAIVTMCCGGGLGTGTLLRRN
jgi:acetyl-CoA C-acetyltransferase